MLINIDNGQMKVSVQDEEVYLFAMKHPKNKEICLQIRCQRGSYT